MFLKKICVFGGWFSQQNIYTITKKSVNTTPFSDQWYVLIAQLLYST